MGRVRARVLSSGCWCPILYLPPPTITVYWPWSSPGRRQYGGLPSRRRRDRLFDAIIAALYLSRTRTGQGLGVSIVHRSLHCQPSPAAAVASPALSHAQLKAGMRLGFQVERSRAEKGVGIS